MDHFERFESSNFNGLRRFEGEERFPPQHHHSRPNHQERHDKRSYKLVCDPALRHGPQKIYRFDGESATEQEVTPADPRSRFKRFWTRREPVFLPVPQFQYDEHYVGKPLAKEVTFVNLNDNINQNFLNDMCKSFGTIEEVKIYFHPRTKKHLGVAKVLFTSTKSARLCAEKYNETSKMGNVMSVFVDVMGKERATIVERLSQDLPNKFRPPSPERKKHPDGENRDRRIAARRERERSGGGPPPHHSEFAQPPPGGSTDHPGMNDMPFQDGVYPGGHHADHGGFPGGHFQDGFHAHHMPPPGQGGRFHDNHGPPPFGPDMASGRDHGHGYDAGMNPDFHHPEFDMHPDQYDEMGHHHAPPHHHGNHGHFNQHSFHRKERDRDRHRRDYRKDRRRDSGENERFDRDHRRSRDGKERESRDHRDRRDNKHKERHKEKHKDQTHHQPEVPAPTPIETEPFQPPPQPIRIPHHREDSPVKEEEPRKLSLESRIASLLRTNSQDSESSGMPFGSPDSAQPPLPQESPPPLPEEEAPPLPLPPDDEPPPLPPGEDEAPPVIQWVGGGSQPLPPGTVDVTFPDGSFLLHGDTPNSFLDSQGTTPITFVDDGSRASGTPALENGSAHGTPQYQEVVVDIKPKKQRKDSSDMELEDDKMSLASNEGEAENAGETADKVRQISGAGLDGDSYYGGVTLDDLSLDQVMSELSLDSHREVEENTFSNVLDQVVKELKMIVGRDIDKRMIHNAGFKSFDNWWVREETEHKKTQGKQGLSGSKGAVPSAQSTVPQDMSSSLSAFFWKKEDSDLTHHGPTPGGLLGIRGHMPKLPSFKKKQSWRPPTPPGEEPEDEDEEEEKKGPKTPPDVSDEESEPELELTEAQKAASSKKQRVQIYSSDDESEDSDFVKPESEDEKSSEEEEAGSSSASSSSEDEAESSDEESSSSSSDDEEEIDVGTEQEVSDVDKNKKSEKDIKENRKVKVKEEKRDKEDKVDAKQKVEPDASLPAIKEEDDEDEVIQVDDSLEEGEVCDKSDEANTQVAESKKDESARKVEALSEKERGAFDVLMELKKTQINKREATAAHDVEKDAALALLQMGSDAKQRDAEEAAKREQQLQKERATIAVEHDYFARPGPAAVPVINVDTDETDSADEGDKHQVPTLPPNVAIDHNYCRMFFPTDEELAQGIMTPRGVVTNIDDIIEGAYLEKQEELRQGKQKRKYVRKPKLADVTNLQGNRELASLFAPAKPRKPPPDFKVRSMHDDLKVKYDFLIRGIDDEDIRCLKRSYEDLLQNVSENQRVVHSETLSFWLNGTHWMDHSKTLIPDPQPPKKRRKNVDDDLPTPHKSGCGRTEGYYKISHQAKSYLRAQRQVDNDERLDVDATEAAEKKKKMSRDARSETRRIQNVLSSMGEDLGDLLKFNQLQFRKKAMTFRRSSIHDWGLFAQEPIAAEEMVIEYVGQVLRHSVADLREKKYEASGIGSSYLFRIDHDNVIDATKYGNLARFINHSCNPNCYAKIITVEGFKKIVIYSKRDIDMNEEITYDYKFPIEEVKIPCLCGAPNCRRTLN